TIYQNTTLGNRLQQSFHELIRAQQVTPQLALRVLPQFDKAVNSALAQRVRNRVNFRGSLNMYGFCDNVTGVLVKERDTTSLFLSPPLSLFLSLSVSPPYEDILRRQSFANQEERS
uniref:Transcription initiation factor IIA gamma chain n=1 Tax=Sus scrofa TaxID=9823 RepID=A0A8D1K8Z2_PIG